MATSPGVYDTLAAVDLITTQLNALAPYSKAVGAAVTNAQGTGTTAGYPFGTLELYLPAPSAGSWEACIISGWFCRAPNGTDYEDGTSAAMTFPVRPCDFVLFPVAAGTGAQRLIAVTEEMGPNARKPLIRMPAGLFKTVLYLPPNMGATLAATANILKWYPTSVG
jgi:hypothetical protein